MNTVDVLLTAWIPFLVVVLLRNDAVYRIRIAIIDIETPSNKFAGLELYRRLPSYDEMLLHPAFWLKWTKADWLEYIGEGSAS